MRDFILTNIDQNEYLHECDVCLSMCEYYMKQWEMNQYYQEAGVAAPAPAQPAPAPAQPAAQPAAPAQAPPVQAPAQPPAAPAASAQPPAQQQGGDQQNQGQNVNINISGNIGQTLMKLIEILTKVVGQFVQDQASKAVQQDNEKMENEIEQLREQVPQQGVDLSNEQTVNKIVEELAPADEDEREPMTEKEKKLTKCILVGNFQDCMILSPQSIEVLNQVNTTLKSIIDTIKSRVQSPEQMAATITQQLKVTINDQMLAPLAGGTRQDNMSSNQSTQMQMNWKQFRENEKNAFTQMDTASKQLNEIDQQFRTGGLGGFFKWATSKDIRAQSVSKDAMAKLQNALGLVRKSMGFIMQDIKSVRKVNKKVIKKMRTICVGGNNSVANFANRKSTQNAGVTSQYVTRQDKGKFQNFQGNAMGNGFNAKPA